MLFKFSEISLQSFLYQEIKNLYYWREMIERIEKAVENRANLKIHPLVGVIRG